MSLILEALRKSEAERRRGQAPDLLSETTPAAPAARTALSPGSRWLFAVVAMLVVAMLVLLGWPRGAATPAADERTAAGPVATEADAPPSPPDATRLARVPERAAALPVRPAAAAAVQPPAPNADVATPIKPPAPPARDAAVAATAVATAAPVPPIAPPEPEPAAAAEPAAAPAVSFTSPDVPLRLGDLSGEERRQLPAMKMSMHMWAPDAAHRFAIIDGNRVNEGDRVGEATVEAIQQDGVMLTWRGRRIRLPIR